MTPRRASADLNQHWPEVPSQVAVIGAGHVGLPTAAALTAFGHQVRCAESDPARLRRLKSGELPILEDGLLDALRNARQRHRLEFIDSAAEAARGADFVFLCVQTPQQPDGSADLSYLEQAALDIRPTLRAGCIVVNKSTVPIGSTTFVEGLLSRQDVHVVSNPEFLREGTALSDSLHPDRIVVGASDLDAAALVGALFRRTGAPLVITDPLTAETVKYVANAFLATKVSFMNTVANLCEAVNADIRDVILGLGYDRRIGFDFLRPGPGWGGSCLPKDTEALLSMAAQADFDFTLLRTVIAINRCQVTRMVDKLENAIRSHFQVDSSSPVLEGRRIAVWGLTFKADTDDLRESPALRIVSLLIAKGAQVSAFEPSLLFSGNGSDFAARIRTAWGQLGAEPEALERLTIAPTAIAACRNACGLMLLTEWEEFRQIDFPSLAQALSAPILIDARNLLDPQAARAAGFHYCGVGRK